MSQKIILVAGTRPNFMKVAPLCAELKRRNKRFEVFYSGQHYDQEMFAIFKDQLSLSDGYVSNLTMDGNPIKNIQIIMGAFRSYLKKQTEVGSVVVVGDVNTTYACALVVKEFPNIKLIHVEAGLRSFDQGMPEEPNRMTVDHISDILFASCEDSYRNLLDEGLSSKSYLVGNVMIDCLNQCLPSILARDFPVQGIERNYVIVTLHRPENVDDKETLTTILNQLGLISHVYDVIIPLHPRTRERIKDFGLNGLLGDFNVISSLGYLDFMRLVYDCFAIITDSGGIQEETSKLGVQCITIRRNTERPITIRKGTNRLVSFDSFLDSVLNLETKNAQEIQYWDGKASERIISILEETIDL